MNSQRTSAPMYEPRQMVHQWCDTQCIFEVAERIVIESAPGIAAGVLAYTPQKPTGFIPKTPPAGLPTYAQIYCVANESSDYERVHLREAWFRTPKRRRSR